MKNPKDKKDRLRANEDMMKKILIGECGDCDTDEFAADELDLRNYLSEDVEVAEDGEIGESEYFSTCEYTMIPRKSEEDGTVNCQGS